MMASSFVTALHTQSVGDRHQLANPPVSRVVSHPGQHFFVRAHRIGSVAYGTTGFQPFPLDVAACPVYANSVTGVPVIGFSSPDSRRTAAQLRHFLRPFAWQRPLWAGPCGEPQGSPVPTAGLLTCTVPSTRLVAGADFRPHSRSIAMDIHAPGASAPWQAAKPAVFQFHSTEVRTVDRDGQVWFIASDIAKALNYSETKDMTRFLDEDEADRHIMPVRSENGTLQTREVTIISESGLYHALLKSRKREAKPFRKWVTAEVLPAIRRSGGYGGSASAPDPLDLKEPIEALHQFWEECADVVKTSGGTVPRWPDIDLRELAMGLVGDYLATRARFLLDFDHIGTPHLQFVPPGASILSATDKISMSTLMREYIPGEMLPDLMRIGLDRLARMAERGRNAPVRANPIDKEVKP